MSIKALEYMKDPNIKKRPQDLPGWVQRTTSETKQLGSAYLLHNRSKNCLAVALSNSLQQAVTQSGIKIDATSKSHWDNVPLDEMLLRFQKLAKLTGNANFAIQLGQPYQIGWKQGENYSVIFPDMEQLEGLISYQLWLGDTPIMHYAYLRGGKLLETGPKPETRNVFSSMKEHYETMKPRDLFYPHAAKGRVAVLFMPLITPQLILNYWVFSKTLLLKLERQEQVKSALSMDKQLSMQVRLLTLIGFLKAYQKPDTLQKCHVLLPPSNR